jgi:cardiolipin synthase A/B
VCNGVGTGSVDAGLPVDGPNTTDAPRADAGTRTDVADAVDSASDGGAGMAAVTLIVEPSDSGSAILAAIQSATKSVHVASHILLSTALIDELSSAQKKGLDVKVLLDAATPVSTLTSLRTSGVDVVSSPERFVSLHENCVIVDAASAWIVSGDLTTSAWASRQYIAVDSIPDDVAEAEQVFASDSSGQVVAASGNLVVAPDNARQKLIGLIDSARVEIDVETQEVSDNDVVAALEDAADRGVRIDILVDGATATSASSGAATTVLKSKGVSMRTAASPLVEANALLLDGSAAYVGSATFSDQSLSENRELGLLVENASALSMIASTIAADFNGGMPL